MDFPEDVLTLNSLDDLALMADEVSPEELVELIRRLGQGPLLNTLNHPQRDDGWPQGWCEALEELVSKTSGDMSQVLEALTEHTHPTKLAMISAMLRHDLITRAQLDEALLQPLILSCIGQVGFHRDQPKPYFHWELDAIRKTWPERQWRPLLLEAAAREDLELEVWDWVAQELLPYASDVQRVHIAAHHKEPQTAQAQGYFDRARAVEVCRQAASAAALEACLGIASRCLGQTNSKQGALFVATVGLAHISDVLGRACPRVDYELWERLGKALGSALTPHLDAIAHTLPQTHYPGARYQETLRYYDQLNAAAQSKTLHNPELGALVEFEVQDTYIRQNIWSAQRPNQSSSSSHQLNPSVPATDQERSLKRALIEQGYVSIAQQAPPMAQLTTHSDKKIYELSLNPSDGTIWAYAPGHEPLLRFSQDGELLTKLNLPLTPKAFSQDGTLLAGVLYNEGVVYDTRQGTLTTLASEGGLSTMCWSADASMLAGLDSMGGLHTWRWPSGARCATRHGAPYGSTITFNPYAELLFFGGCGRTHVLNFETLETLKLSETLPREGHWLNGQRGYLGASIHTMLAHYPLDRARRAPTTYHHQHRLMLSPSLSDQEHTFKFGQLVAQDLSGALVMLYSTHQKHYHRHTLALWDVEHGQARGVWKMNNHNISKSACCISLNGERFFFADDNGLHSFALKPTPAHRVYELHRRDLSNGLSARECPYPRGFEVREVGEDFGPSAHPIGPLLQIKAAVAVEPSNPAQPPIYHTVGGVSAALTTMTAEQTQAFFAQCLELRPAYEAELERLLYGLLADQIELSLWFIEQLPDKVLLPTFSSKKDIARGEPQFIEDYNAWSHSSASPKEPQKHTKKQLNQKLIEIGWGGLDGLKARNQQQLRRFKTTAPRALVANRVFSVNWMLSTEDYERYQDDYFKILPVLLFAQQIETFNTAEFLASMDNRRREDFMSGVTAMSALDIRLFCLTYEDVGGDAARASLLYQGIQAHRSDPRALLNFMKQHGFTQAQVSPTLLQLGLEWPG